MKRMLSLATVLCITAFVQAQDATVKDLQNSATKK